MDIEQINASRCQEIQDTQNTKSDKTPSYMKLDLIGCIFHFQKTENDGSAPSQIEVHFAPTEIGNWMVAIWVNKKCVASFGSALSPTDWHAHNFAWEHLSTNKNPSNEKTDTTD